MIKTLTQDVFKDAPDWVRSAAVDSDGYAWGYEHKASDLYVYNDYVFRSEKHMRLPPYMFGNDYSTTNWQNSAIDRE